MKVSPQQEKILFSADSEGKVSYCGYRTNPRTLRALVGKELIVRHYRYTSTYHLTEKGKQYVQQNRGEV